MSDVTRVLDQMRQGDQHSAKELLPLVYDELRDLASRMMAQEKSGQTLVATALVHEAYLRLMNGHEDQGWNGRGHFFAAAAEAMRRILVEQARRRSRVKHGGGLERAEASAEALVAPALDENLIALDEALDRLAAEDGLAAEIVKLRYFAGLTIPQAAELLGVSPRKANFLWAFARAWLRREIGDE